MLQVDNNNYVTGYQITIAILFYLKKHSSSWQCHLVVTSGTDGQLIPRGTPTEQTNYIHAAGGS